mgnify:CR=1 FL=1|tara:strand:+ start:922 stop:1800 length:879 start_codon:yes stop_codon:yes gene_type:complete
MGLITETASAYYNGSNHGDYQFVSLNDIIQQFMMFYVGEDKIIGNIKRTDVAFHAQRALAELSFDTFKSVKSQEIEIPDTLIMTLPQDYVNYVKLSWTDAAGIKHVIYPTSKTMNPFAIKQNTDGTYDFNGSAIQEQDSTTHNSDTWSNYKTNSPNDNVDQYDDGTYDLVQGERYGIHPELSQVNGSFFIDELQGKIHFSSNISGKTVILEYISDSLGEDAEMKVHKLAEDAMYKWMMFAILSTRSNVQEYIINRYRKEKIAAVRKAKLRLSNIKLEEITQILRGKSKHIKH